MTLPPLLVLTDRRQAVRPLADVVAAAVDGGARAVVLREKDLPREERAALAERLLRVLAGAEDGGRLLLAGTDDLGVGAGVHLAAADPVPEPRPALLGRSCHDAVDVAAAAAQGCDWVTVSPVRETPSKPGYGPALGPDGLRSSCGVPGAPPVYALGGVTAQDAAACRDAGAAGVAVMGAVMRARRPDDVVAALLAAWQAVDA